MAPIKPIVLVTGATGYIGERLVSRLIEENYPVRVLVRDKTRLQGRHWLNQVEVVQGDVLKPETLGTAFSGIDVAFYLIHSANTGHTYRQRDVTAARIFSRGARQAGVDRIVYLSGLGDKPGNRSNRHRFKQRAGDALRKSGVRVTEFRAAMVVGSGSLSFEMIRYLTERLPIMICPRWVKMRVRPIAIRNALDYLVTALVQVESAGEIIEIGGSNSLTYGQMISQYAEVRGLRRIQISLPILSPRLSSYWIHWMTPVPASIARPFIDGLRHEVIVSEEKARHLFPTMELLGYKTAVRRGLAHLQAGDVETSWKDALATSQGDFAPVILRSHDGLLIEQRQQIVKAPPLAVFQIFSGIGGDRGWPYFNWAWQLRGIMDRLIGGVGLRRGRRDPDELRVGDALDFWRVEAIKPGRLLRLRAEMKLPGLAWLQYEATSVENSKIRLTQTAFFASKGLLGLLYWYILYPIHGLIFSGTIRDLAKKAEMLAEKKS
jgi:uncharacterized protein YbjT (DUF2867 family)